MLNLQDEYKKQRALLRRRVSYWKAKGVDILDEILPPIPKRITAGSIRRLQRITGEVIAKKYAPSKTKKPRRNINKYKTKSRRNVARGKKSQGKTKTGKAPQQKSKDSVVDNAPRYNSFGEVALSNLRALLDDAKSTPHFGHGAFVIESVIDNLVSRYGDDVVGDAVAKLSGEGISLGFLDLYEPNTSARERFVSHLLSNIDEVGDFTRDDFDLLLSTLEAGYTVEE
jgi:hypothetical protein